MRCFPGSTPFVLVAPLLMAAFFSVAALVAGGGRGSSSDPAARYVLGHVNADPGTAFTIPLEVSTGLPLSMVTWSIEFDPSALQFDELFLGETAQTILDRLPNESFSFQWFVDNDAGWLQVSLVLDFEGRVPFAIPPSAVGSLADLRFSVEPNTTPGVYGLRFTRAATATYVGNFGDGQDAVYNRVHPAGVALNPATVFVGSSEPELEDGTVLVAPIIGDVGIFRRGDANLDQSVNVADALTILNALFGQGPSLSCEGTADANFDGDINISDPLSILNYLFMGADWTQLTIQISQGPETLSCFF